jgi:hypothetical protein
MPLEIVLGAVVGAAATGAVASEPIRRKLRRGLVYGLAGVLVAYDKVAALTQSAVHSARQVVSEAGDRAAEASANKAPGAGPTVSAESNAVNGAAPVSGETKVAAAPPT